MLQGLAFKVMNTFEKCYDTIPENPLVNDDKNKIKAKTFILV